MSFKDEISVWSLRVGLACSRRRLLSFCQGSPLTTARAAFFARCGSSLLSFSPDKADSAVAISSSLVTDPVPGISLPSEGCWHLYVDGSASSSSSSHWC